MDDSERNGRTSGVSEWFFLADRRVGWLAGSTSLAATQVSAGTFVGAVGIHYAVGVSFALAWLGIWAGWLFSMVYVAPQLRAFGGVTVPEFFGERFDDGAGGDRIQAFTAVLVATIYLVFTSAQYLAGSVVLETALGVPPVYGMTALALLALIYTAFGGMLASVVTDVVLTIVLVGGLLVATVVGLSRIGGPLELRAAVAGTDPTLLELTVAPVDVAGFALAFGLSLAVAPYEIGRVYAMRDERTVRRAIAGSVGIQVLIAACILVVGLLARVQYPGLSNPDAAVVQLITAYFDPVVGGLLFLGVVAAVLSTVDSILLVSASAIAYDLYESVLASGRSDPETPATPSDPTTDQQRATLLGRLLSDHIPSAFVPAGGWSSADRPARTLWVARLATVVSGLVPLGLALNSGLFGGLVQLVVVLYAALIASALFVPVVLGLHWGGTTGRGAVAGMLAGTVATVVWHVTSATALLSEGVTTVPPVVVGVASSLLVTVALSVEV